MIKIGPSVNEKSKSDTVARLQFATTCEGSEEEYQPKDHQQKQLE